ncbi:acetolactate decarboxylase [Paludisphaera soli]|uniref:acetolactate decarboxylase n=1 Tax=Paludisphaera soli TaxID=2712865 RepID=UPI0013EB1615
MSFSRETGLDLAGAFAGIRRPAWVGGVSVPAYHLHFPSDARKFGGHVLACRVREGRVHRDVRCN